MLKHINRVLNIVMGVLTVAFIGHSLWRYVDYRSHPRLYARYSAPWYTSILVWGTTLLFALLLCIVIKLIIKYKLKKKSS